MSIVALPLRLRHREINGPTSSILRFNLNKLNNLQHLKYNEGESAEEISSILIWIAKNYPEILDDVAKDFFEDGFLYLSFQYSWEHPDELVPTDAVKLIMNSDIGANLKFLRGYFDPKVLMYFRRSFYNLSLAIGKNTNVLSLLQEIQSHQERNCDFFDESKDKIWIHLRCGEIDLEDIPSLPVIHNLTLIISNTSDQDIAWVVEANAKFRMKNRFRSFNNISNIFANMDNLFLPRSKLTKVGIEAISKGLVDKGLGVAWLAVSSSGIDDDVYWRQMIQVKFDFGFVSLCTDKDINFVC